MRIHSIEWHERNLESYKDSLERKIRERDRLQREVDTMTESFIFRRMQIEKARKMGKESFDADRFCVTRKRVQDE